MTNNDALDALVRARHAQSEYVGTLAAALTDRILRRKATQDHRRHNDPLPTA